MKLIKLWLPVFVCCVVCFAAGGSARRVLIVAEKENLNDPVISKVKSAIKKDGCSVSVTGKRELGDKTTKKFGAVLVINRTAVGQKPHGVKMFLSDREQKKIVLFNAVGSRYWLSADKTDESEKLAESILANIRAVLEAD
ncbi:MAG: hypothetical protein CVU80_00065 [Elusimicrobia bacterium HGW-Elusimicrobia-4]|nr:MAG: hypothetical protein CVU80_00065 [Elusimicrobia bacterium HGW-Elusimicrobia-4]